MRITILGGAGFLGRKLATRLAKDGALGGRAITGLTLFDLAAPATLAAPFPVTCLGGDVADPVAVAAAIPAGTEVVFHLAAVVSAAAASGSSRRRSSAQKASSVQFAALSLRSHCK